VEGRTIDGKAYITLILACGASLCAGAVGGFLLARAQGKRDFEDRVSAKVSEEVEEVKRYYQERLALQVAEAERRGVAMAAASMADPGPGDHEDERSSSLGGGSFGSETWQRAAERTGHTPYHRPSGIPTAPASAVQDDDADEDPDGGDPPEGLSDTGVASNDPSFWPAEDPADSGPEPDVHSVEGGFAPFLITRTEFDDAEETSNQKVGITYYMGDGVLADDHDVPIRDSAELVGTDFLAGFGSTDDPDIVYVRNNTVQIDFEIVRSQSGYAEHVLEYGKPQ
jgi:hypothetical protein